MKRFIYSIFCCLSFFVTASCSEEIAPEFNTVNPGDITLSIFSAVPATRAIVGDIPGVKALNENKIQTVHYFFYPKNVGADNTEFQPALIGKKEWLSADTEYSWTINVTDDKLKKTLFPMPYNTCDVYVIVNLPEAESKKMEEDPNYDMSLSNLRTIALEANFNTTDPQSSFVMEGLGVATIIDRKAILAAEGNIEVDRVAAKISVNIQVDDQLTTSDGETLANGKVWESMPEDMTVELVNGVKTAVLKATPTPVTKGNMFSTSPRGVTGTADVWSCVPFYSYPASWEVGAETEPYLRIILPWKTEYDKNVNGEPIPWVETKKCVYKVILGGESLKRNTWYDLNINIGILGSFENEKEVVIPLENTHYFVVDWSTGLSTDASIEGARYLIVDKAKYEVYTQDEVRIPFTSSHICEIVDMAITPKKNQATVIYPDYSKVEANENREITWNSSWYLAIEKNEIVLKHTLRNDISQDDFDYAPYTFKFRIRHTDVDDKGNPYGDIYYKDITIVQYPAMVIEAQVNRELQGEGGYGGTYVNSYQDNSTYAYGGLYTLNGNPATKNPNMYVIKASVLPSTSNLIIGDSRSIEPTNLNNSNWAIAPDMEGGSRKLQKYYPTLTTSDVKYMVAPKFRTASSHGVCNSELSYANAEYRCASYQEDGYPAGRWRIPTLGEVQFMVTLSNEGVIPALYSSIAYWYAGGVVQNNGGNLTITEGTTGRNARVRCVYDEWYWENTGSNRLPGNNYAFTWGDAER